MGEYLTTEHVAHQLGVRVETVRRWVRMGKLSGFSIGRAGYRIRQDDLEHFVQSQGQHAVARRAQDIFAVESNASQDAMEATATMILERMSDGVLLFGANDQCLYANEAVGRLFGQKPGDLVGKTLVELFFVPLLDADAATINDGTDYFAPATNRWYRVRMFATPQGRCVSFLDVTERKLAEEALRDSEEKYHTIFTMMDQGFCVIEKLETGEGEPSDFIHLEINPAYERHTGLHNLVGRTILQVMPQVQQSIMDCYDRVALTGVSERFEVYMKPLDAWIEAGAFPTQKPGRISVLFSNISERKRTELALQEERAVLKSFYDGVPFMMGVAELDGGNTVAVSANKKMGEFFRRATDDFRGRSGIELGTPEEVERLWVEQYRRCERERDAVTFAYHEPRLGEESWLNVTLSFIAYEANGRPRFSFVVEDISERVHMEQALHESEQRVQAERQKLYDLFMQAPAAIMVIKGPQHIYELINPLALKIMGNHRQIIGRTVREVLPEAEQQGFLALLDNVYQTGQPFVGNEILGQFDNTGDGTLMPAYFNFVYQPSYNAAREIDGILCYVNDVTETVQARKRVEESEQSLRSLADSMPQLVWSARADGEIDFFNERMHEYADMTRNEEGVYDWRTLIHADDLKKTERAWEHAKSMKSIFEHEQRMRMRNGVYRWHLARGVPVFDADGSVVRWYGTKTDIEQLKRLDQQKNDFLGVVSHELKTPVTSAKAFAEVLESRFRKAGDQRSAELLGKLSAQMDKLTRLIGDLLDITRLDAGKLHFHENFFVFDELVDAICEEVQRTTTHQIRKEGRTDKRVYGDRERIGQVITNLLTNAIKYSPYATTVVVHTSMSEQDVMLSVQDFGIGIATDKLPHVFERFFRENEGREDTFAGLGLGLYVSSEIIRRQGGTIWVESEKGSGSTFCFRLPFQHVDTTRAAEQVLKEGEVHE